MTSTSASTVPSQQPRAVKQAAVITHGKPQAIGSALARLANVARESGVELHLAAGESEKHGLEPGLDDADVDIAVVLGGDGTMLRGLTRFLGTGVPVIGVNFGRVGFLTSIERDEIETGLARVFAGDYTVDRAADARRRGGRRATRGAQRPRRHEWRPRPHDSARVGGRRGAARADRLRRDRLLDAVRIDGLQPLERRAGARLGDRRDGRHLRRAARRCTRARS